MKLHGKKVEGPNVEVVVIPRGNGEDVVFHCTAVLDMSGFEKLCPTPLPPERIMPGGKREAHTEDVGYMRQMQEFGEKRISYLILQSLKATEGLEWETVNEEDHNSWKNIEGELKASGFSHVEIQRIVNGVFAANCLNEARVEEARKNFLRGTAARRSESFGLATELNSTPSGTPANASA